MQLRNDNISIRIVPNSTFFSRLIMNSLFNSEDSNFPIRNLFLRHFGVIDEDEQDEEETSENPNFMQEKNMNFRLFPFYIDGKKLNIINKGIITYF